MSVFESTATELLAELTAGRMTATELTQAYLGQIEKHDGAIGAFLNVDAERALSQAKGIDARRRAGAKLGLLAGLPVAVKDVLCTKGDPATGKLLPCRGLHGCYLPSPGGN